MKQLNRLMWNTLFVLILPAAAFAAFTSGSTGVDGAFAPATDTVLQLPDSGVFNYTTVTIPAGVTVTFTKNSQNTPVTILATGDVTVNGTISINGSDANYIIPGTGGPGGFSGGVAGVVYQVGKRGEGPGGGYGGSPNMNDSVCAGEGGGGGFGIGGGAGPNNCVAGGPGGSSYGNEVIIPAIGGSGGGGGGGGTITIASSGKITIAGSITANGGNGANGESQDCGWWGCNNRFRGGGGGGGTGGSIRLIANVMDGNGNLSASGGGGGRGWGNNAGGGSVGRIRLEASNVLRTTSTSPPMSLGYPYAVTPPNMPSLAITSIGGMDVPTVPKGAFGAPDVMLPFNTKNPIAIVVTGTNIPSGQTVNVSASPSVGATTSASGILSGTDTSSSASVNLSIATSYPSIITTSVTFQLSALNGTGPIFADGEKVKFMRVAACLGGKSTITYITESGKEVPAVL